MSDISHIRQDYLSLSAEKQNALFADLKATLSEAHKDGNTTSALETGRLETLLQPDNPWWLYTFADDLREIGRREEAEPLLLEVYPRTTPPGRYRVEASLGQLCRDSGRFQEAERWFKRATESAPNDTAPWVFLGGFFARTQRFAEACAVLERGLEAQGDVDEVWLNLGLNKRTLDDYEGARRCFSKAIELSPDYSAAVLALQDIELAIRVRSLRKQPVTAWDFGSLKQAEPTQKKPMDGATGNAGDDISRIRQDYLSLSPDKQNALLADLEAALFEAYKSVNWTSPVEISRLGTLLQPANPLWLYTFADDLREIGRREEAEPLLLEVYPRTTPPGRYRVEASLGQLCRDSGRFQEAERWFKRATESAPNDTAPWVFLGGFFARTQRFAEACAVLERGLEAQGDVDEVWLNLGLNKRTLDDYEGARRCFSKAIELSPDYSAAVLALQDIELAIRVRSLRKQPVTAWDFGSLKQAEPTQKNH